MLLKVGQFFGIKDLNLPIMLHYLYDQVDHFLFFLTFFKTKFLFLNTIKSLSLNKQTNKKERLMTKMIFENKNTTTVYFKIMALLKNKKNYNKRKSFSVFFFFKTVLKIEQILLVFYLKKMIFDGF